MARMLELIQQSAVPAAVMRSAARGALALPAGEMLEILVYLSHHALWAEQARMALAGFEEAEALPVVSDANAPIAVLEYFLDAHNRRPGLMPALLDNPSVSEAKIAQAAETASAELARQMLASARAKGMVAVLEALAARHEFEPALQRAIADARAAAPAESAAAPSAAPDAPLELPELDAYLKEHAAEIAAEENKPFTLFGWEIDEEDLLGLEWVASGAAPESVKGAGSEAVVAVRKRHLDPTVAERVSVFHKISRMNVHERVQLAMKGTKEERFILIRDGARVVALAVLESPKLNDSEVEMFATLKNVQEQVLRSIALKRKFIRNYSVVRALVFNPRCPIDVALPYVGHLLLTDLKNLSVNKNVNDTLRKSALRLVRQKAIAAQGGRE